MTAREQCSGCPYNGQYKCAPPQDPSVPCPQRAEIAQKEQQERRIDLEPVGAEAFWSMPGETYGPFLCSLKEAIGGPIIEYWAIDERDVRYKGRLGLAHQVLAHAWAGARGRAKEKWGRGHWQMQVREIGTGILIATAAFGRKEN